MGFSRAFSSARHRTKATTTPFGHTRLNEEFSLAMFAGSFYSAIPCSIFPGYKILAILNKALSIAVTCLTRYGKIFERVISPVIVDVIYHNAIVSCSSAVQYHPRNFTTTPMAEMRARAKSVIKQHSGLGNITIFCSEWMRRIPNYSSGFDFVRRYAFVSHVPIISQYYSGGLP